MSDLHRRDFLRATGAVAAGALPLFAAPRVVAAPAPTSAAETAAKALFETLTPEQRKAVCFAWDHTETGPKGRGLLRTFVSNNWQITPHNIRGDFYTKKQQHLIHDAFKGLVSPEFYPKFMKQLSDDTGGAEWGEDQSIALFGEPGGKFEMVMTGRHLTLRADGNSENHVAFGGPIFYGHAAQGFTEKPDHPGNVFWPQAVRANGVYNLLDSAQRKRALVAKRPPEAAVGFRAKKDQPAPGLPVRELTGDVRAELQKVLASLLEPFRAEDRDEASACLSAQGGLDACTLTFYSDGDTGADGVWDNWRVEGPSFVWHFRGSPHVHVWVNVADDAGVKLNARG